MPARRQAGGAPAGAARGGDIRFAEYFLGTDSAPHARHAKESACGCAGIFNAPHALESYATVFEEEGALDRLEGFASEHGPRFYGLPLNQGTVTLERAGHTVPATLGEGETLLVPFHAGERLSWRLRAGASDAAPTDRTRTARSPATAG